MITLLAAGAAALYIKNKMTNTEQNAITTDNPAEGSSQNTADIVAGILDSFTPSQANNPTAMDDAGVQAIADREGFSAMPYADHKGWSIGYGHLIKSGENLPTVTQDQARTLLMFDIAWAQDAVSSAITVPLTQNQFNALTSFCYNVGAGAFKKSTLVKRINANDPGAIDEFSRWIFASGQPNAALQARRASEAQQFATA